MLRLHCYVLNGECLIVECRMLSVVCSSVPVEWCISSRVC